MNDGHVGKPIRLHTLPNPIEEHRHDVYGKHRPLLPYPPCDFGREQARPRTDVGDDHPLAKADRIDDLIAMMNDLAAFGFEDRGVPIERIGPKVGFVDARPNTGLVDYESRLGDSRLMGGCTTTERASGSEAKDPKAGGRQAVECS